MTPDIFLDRLRKSGPAPAYLFLGPEPYHRERSRRALIEAALPAEDRENGFTYHDLDQVSLREALDDARSFSLFASKRVVWLASAESAVPRTEPESDDPSGMGAYLREPVPGTMVVESSRYDFDGEDKAKLERVQKFYSAIPNQVEFRPLSPESARATAQLIAKEAGLALGLAELAILLEATAGDVARIAVEIEKLKLFAGARKVTVRRTLPRWSPTRSQPRFSRWSTRSARATARVRSNFWSTLTRAGEYMPLALTFLATQFRMALAAREANLRGAGQIQSHFNQIGARIWPDRARQIEQTVQAFPKAKLERAVVKLFEADRSLRDARPDDRIVMEEMILALTKRG